MGGRTGRLVGPPLGDLADVPAADVTTVAVDPGEPGIDVSVGGRAPAAWSCRSTIGAAGRAPSVNCPSS